MKQVMINSNNPLTMIWFKQTVSIWLFKTKINTHSRTILVLKVWQPLWTLLCFKISSILHCFADICWFFPFPMHASLCIPSWHSSTDISWGGLSFGVAPQSSPSSGFPVRVDLHPAARCWLSHSCMAFSSFRSQHKCWGAALQTGDSTSQLCEPLPSTRGSVNQWCVNMKWEDRLSFINLFISQTLSFSGQKPICHFLDTHLTISITGAWSSKRDPWTTLQTANNNKQPPAAYIWFLWIICKNYLQVNEIMIGTDHSIAMTVYWLLISQSQKKKSFLLVFFHLQWTKVLLICGWRILQTSNNFAEYIGDYLYLSLRFSSFSVPTSFPASSAVFLQNHSASSWEGLRWANAGFYSNVY